MSTTATFSAEKMYGKERLTTSQHSLYCDSINIFIKKNSLICANFFNFLNYVLQSIIYK